ncbi:MAG TPA: hypothetical protein VGE59_01265 [Patescibacteria group bacterium]
MKKNKAWHHANELPDEATLQQQIAWHLAHQKYCACKEIPKTVLKALKKK